MAAPRAATPAHEDGMDILKFFIAIMGFLTLLVAVMALLNWSRATDLRAEIEEDESNLEAIQKLASNKEFRDLIAKDRASKDLVDVLKKDLGEHLQQTAAKMGISFLSFSREGAGGGRAQQGFDKISYKFTLDKLRLEVVTEFLFYLQLSWPGLKIEGIIVAEASRVKKEDDFPNWKTTVTVSIFRPKAGA